MNTQRSKTIVRRLHEEVFVDGNTEMIDELVSRDYISHQVDGDLTRDEEFRGLLPKFRKAFPDLKFNFTHLIAEDDLVAARYTIQGTHENEFKGMPPTGKTFKISGLILERVEDGKIVESWPLRDRMGMMEQLGLVPELQIA